MVLALAALLALVVVALISAGSTPGTAHGLVRAAAVAADLVPAQPPPVPPPPDATCDLTNLGGCVSGAVDSFLRGLVADALNPLLTMLSDTLLTTPSLDQLPGLRELWGQSWQIVLAAYGLLVLLAGILLMGYDSTKMPQGLLHPTNGPSLVSVLPPSTRTVVAFSANPWEGRTRRPAPC